MLNDQGQAAGTHPHTSSQQSLPVPQANEVVVDDAGALPNYANFCRVTGTPEEIILDFGLNLQPFALGRQDVKVDQRIVMSLYTTKRLLAAIGMTIERHEQTFGVLELDVNRRVASQQHQLVPSAAQKPSSQPEIIKF
jgi:hypothetical protein